MHLATSAPRCPTPEVRPTRAWRMRARDMERDPHMARLVHGIWARWDDDERPHALEPWEKAALALPIFGRHAAVCGISAARILQVPLMTGMPWLDHLLDETGTWTPWFDRPEIALPAPTKSKPLGGVHLRRLQDPMAVQPGPWHSHVTGALETLLVLQDWLRGWRTVVAVDHVLARNLSPLGDPEPLQPAELKLRVESLPAGTRGKRLLAQAVDRSAPHSWSPMETVLRLVVQAAGLPTGEHNVPVDLGRGRRVYLDLVWRDKLVALEYNGAVHYQDRAAYGDERGRLNALQDQGWSVPVVVLDDLRIPARRDALIRWLRTRL